MKTICLMRDAFRAMENFEASFEKVYNVSINEAMILCDLNQQSPEMVTATAISKQTELTPSHTSKMLRILEEKKLIIRKLGQDDRRLMKFQLSKEGTELVNKIELESVKIPELLMPLFKGKES